MWESLDFMSHKDIVNIINKKLNMAQREILRMTCFEHFLSLKKTEFSTLLIHFVLFHLINCGDIKKELWLRLNDIDLCFSLLEFTMVTRLILRAWYKCAILCRYFKMAPIEATILLGCKNNKLFGPANGIWIKDLGWRWWKCH